MADTTRINSLSILTETGDGQAYLSEQYGAVIDNVQNALISTLFKNDDLSGDISSGTVIATKLTYGEPEDYGTARSRGSGQKIRAMQIPLKLNPPKEFIYEVSEIDTRTFGVTGLVERKMALTQDDLFYYLDTEFWKEAASAGKVLTPTGANIAKKCDAAIVDLESYKDKFVRGVPRDRMGLILNPAAYTALQGEIDLVHNNLTGNDYECFHKVRVFCSTNIPDGTDGILLAKKAIAQPWTPIEVPCGKIPLSIDYSFGFDVAQITKATSPELIRCLKGLVDAA